MAIAVLLTAGAGLALAKRLPPAGAAATVAASPSATPVASPGAAASATAAPSGTATLCNDGSYNAEGDANACAQHGGVAPNGVSYSLLPAALGANQPDQVVGRLTVDGRPAAAGLSVAAYSGLTLCGSAVSSTGQFALSLDSAVDVCWAPHTVISFRVNGVPTHETFFTPPVASLVRIDLTVDGVSAAPAAAAAAGTASPIGGTSFVSVQGAAPGGTASATVQASPGAACTLVYTTPDRNVSTAAQLRGSRMADASGLVSWSWPIEPNTIPGQGTLTVQCSPGGSSTTPIQIG